MYTELSILERAAEPTIGTRRQKCAKETHKVVQKS